VAAKPNGFYRLPALLRLGVRAGVLPGSRFGMGGGL